MPNFHINVQKGDRQFNFDLESAQEKSSSQNTVTFQGKLYCIKTENEDDLTTINKILDKAREESIDSLLHLDMVKIDSETKITCKKDSKINDFTSKVSKFVKDFSLFGIGNNSKVSHPPPSDHCTTSC